MSLVCPRCEVVPGAAATLGQACASCGATLVLAAQVDLGALGDLQVVDLAERTGAPPIAQLEASPIASTAPPQHLPKAATEQLHPDIVNLAASDEKLELEGGWADEKAARVAGKQQPSTVAARVAAEERARRKSAAAAGGLWIAIVLIVAVGGGAAYLVLREDGTDPAETTTSKTRRTPPSAPPIDKPADKPVDKPVDKPTSTPRAPSAPATSVPVRGVAIRIVGANGTPVTIDGAAAGKTPLSLKKSTSTRPLVIGAAGKKWTVIPDRDQTIDITAP